MKVICFADVSRTELILWNSIRKTYSLCCDKIFSPERAAEPYLQDNLCSWEYAAEIELEQWDFDSLYQAMITQKLANPMRISIWNRDFQILQKNDMKTYLIKTPDSGLFVRKKNLSDLVRTNPPGTVFYELNDPVTIPEPPDWFKPVLVLLLITSTKFGLSTIIVDIVSILLLWIVLMVNTIQN